MSKRLAWLLAAVMLIGIGFLLACGSNYSQSSDGLVLVGSQGSALVESFSFSLASGRISGISNPPSSTGANTCGLPGLPSSMVIDPAGAYAYVILNATTACSGSKTGIASFKVNSDGTVGSIGTVTSDPNPVQLLMDPSGKFLFVAEGTAGTVNSYSISGGNLTAVPGTFTFTNGTGFQTPNFAAIAVTFTVFPGIGLNGQQNSVCSDVGNTPPPTEYLFAADTVNNGIWQFEVDTSSGVLKNPSTTSNLQYFAAGTQPSGVAVDPCDRFVYVGNYLSNNVSAFTICNGLSTSDPVNCPGKAPGFLIPVSGSPFSLAGGANGPGQMLVDPFGRFLYVLDMKSNQISPFQISPVSGSLTAETVVSTGLQPMAMAIRADDSWMFVTNFNAATLSQYSITPSSGSLSPQPAITTDNYPWGVAVK